MVTLTIEGLKYNVQSLPGECPRCRRAIAAIPRSGGISLEYPFDDTIQCVFQCPACRLLFVGTYVIENHLGKLKNVEPVKPLTRRFGALETLSPQFSTIYNQASAAEASGLGEIAGLGYRKSLEFLVKDYCISKNPGDAEVIKTEFLGNVIKNRIPDRKIMMAAEKAVWLGNDEAHYFRRWEDHDVSDLKSLLELTVSGISEDIQYDEYMKAFATKSGKP